MIATEQLAESRRLLNRARLIAEASAAEIRIGRGHPHSQEPPGLVFTTTSVTHAPSTLETFGQRINLAIAHDSGAELAEANRWCAGQLEQLQHGPKEVAETPAEFSLRIVRVYEGVTAPAVARQERTYVARVRAARTEHGRTARFGYKPEAGGA